jgi:xanthine/CO dehydrogenase XdhC/CoxF family maturation factor
MLNRDEDILKAAEDWQKAGHGVALATVVETWGSAPRPAGSSLVINDDGTFLGSVSGGWLGAETSRFEPRHQR